MQQIPLTADACQRTTCNLGGVEYDLTVKWNSMRGVWTLDIVTSADGQTIVNGAALLLGADVLSGYGLGIGAIVCVDRSAAGLDATEDDLGDRVQVFYFPPDEVAL